MPAMRYLGLLAALAVGCGPSSQGYDVKTPDDLIAEQERLAEEQAEESESHEGSYDSGADLEESDEEKKEKFDKKQADLELKRATRSAETCVGVVTEESPTGTATVTLVFANKGHVKEKSISPPFADTALGKCVLNAMGAVIVPSFIGPEETVEWKVDLEAKEEKK